MARFWPNCDYENINVIYNQCVIGKLLPFNKARTNALNRIGPHNKLVLDVIICGMLGDFGAEKITGKQLDSVRFNIEQSINNTSYIHYLTLFFYNLGYCPRPIPILVEKSDKLIKNRFNYKLTLFTFTSFV
jgi:hypothetical protein